VSKILLKKKAATECRNFELSVAADSRIGFHE
jgi:hypothetical protein